MVAAAADVGGSVEADVFEDTTVVACFLGQVLIMFFKLNKVSVTDCLSLYLSMRISMSFLCASNFFYMDLILLCLSSSSMTNLFSSCR